MFRFSDSEVTIPSRLLDHSQTLKDFLSDFPGHPFELPYLSCFDRFGQEVLTEFIFDPVVFITRHQASDLYAKQLLDDLLEFADYLAISDDYFIDLYSFYIQKEDLDKALLVACQYTRMNFKQSPLWLIFNFRDKLVDSLGTSTLISMIEASKWFDPAIVYLGNIAIKGLISTDYQRVMQKIDSKHFLITGNALMPYVVKGNITYDQLIAPTIYSIVDDIYSIMIGEKVPVKIALTKLGDECVLTRLNGQTANQLFIETGDPEQGDTFLVSVKQSIKLTGKNIYTF